MAAIPSGCSPSASAVLSASPSLPISVRRKTGWLRAEAAGDEGPWRQQAILGRGRWEADALRVIVRDYVTETFAAKDAYADSFDEANGRYRGLRCGQATRVTFSGEGLLVKPTVAQRQQEADAKDSAPTVTGGTTGPFPPEDVEGDKKSGPETPIPATRPRRYFGKVELDATRVGQDAGRIAEEVIAHLAGLVGSTVTVTLEIEAKVPDGAPENVVRTVTENSRTLGFSSQGCERE